MGFIYGEYGVVLLLDSTMISLEGIYEMGIHGSQFQDVNEYTGILTSRQYTPAVLHTRPPC